LDDESRSRRHADDDNSYGSDDSRRQRSHRQEYRGDDRGTRGQNRDFESARGERHSRYDERDNDRAMSGRGDQGRNRGRDRDDRTRDGDRGDDDRNDNHDLGLSFSDDSENGLRIDDIESSGIAARAGIRRGDVIRSVNGRRIQSENDFYRSANVRSGSQIPIVLWRNGRWQTAYLQLQSASYRSEMPTPPRSGGAYLGVVADRRYQDRALIRYVYPNSAADQADLRPGEVILSVDGEDVESPDQLSELLAQYEPGDEVELEVTTNDDDTMEVTVELGRRPSRTSGFSQSGRVYGDQYQARGNYQYREDSGGYDGDNDDQPWRNPVRNLIRPR
jgi:hypothetical protein